MFADNKATRIECRLDHRQSLAGLGISTHEDVESRVAFFGPSMNADVTFSEHGNTRNTATALKSMQMNVQERSSGSFHRIEQRGFNPITVVETLGVP